MDQRERRQENSGRHRFFVELDDKRRPLADADGTVWTASGGGVVEYWNGRMYELIGIPEESPVRAAGTAKGATGAAAQPRTRRVLVVDDNADAAQTVAMLLQVLGYEAAVEYDPLQALACARERAFDAYVLDIGLPGMDGHELARQIRTLPGRTGALFIALTGYGQQQDRDASAAAGFHYHFVKPANVDALARALENGVPV
jgi:CheY-like chemotaxis protein